MADPAGVPLVTIPMGTARARAESLMTSTCTIRELSTGSTMDPATGEVAATPGAVVYSGPCKVRPASGPGGNSTRQATPGVEVFTFDYLISVPFTATGVQERHRVHIDACPDPSLVGIDVEVQHVDRGETITARRLQCREVA